MKKSQRFWLFQTLANILSVNDGTITQISPAKLTKEAGILRAIEKFDVILNFEAGRITRAHFAIVNQTLEVDHSHRQFT